MPERLFKLRERGSSVRVEVIGGATTFVTMAYIIVVNPAILAAAGIPVGPSTVATILSAVFGCLLMGFYANRPIAVAPYMRGRAIHGRERIHRVRAGSDGNRVGVAAWGGVCQRCWVCSD